MVTWSSLSLASPAGSGCCCAFLRLLREIGFEGLYQQTQSENIGFGLRCPCCKDE